MYFMGSEEFKQYLYAESKLRELDQLHRLAITRAYADIHPTRTALNIDERRFYSESINVADYAIYLVDLKDEQKRSLERYKKRVQIFHQALAEMFPDEAATIRAYLTDGGEMGTQAVDKALTSLKSCLEEILGAQNDRPHGNTGRTKV